MYGWIGQAPTTCYGRMVMGGNCVFAKISVRQPRQSFSFGTQKHMCKISVSQTDFLKCLVHIHCHSESHKQMPFIYYIWQVIPMTVKTGKRGWTLWALASTERRQQCNWWQGLNACRQQGLSARWWAIRYSGKLSRRWQEVQVLNPQFWMGYGFLVESDSIIILVWVWLHRYWSKTAILILQCPSAVHKTIWDCCAGRLILLVVNSLL